MREPNANDRIDWWLIWEEFLALVGLVFTLAGISVTIFLLAVLLYTEKVDVEQCFQAADHRQNYCRTVTEVHLPWFLMD